MRCSSVSEMFDYDKNAGQAYTSSVNCHACQHPINNAVRSTKISGHYRGVTGADLNDLDRLGLTNYSHFHDNQRMLDMMGNGVNRALKCRRHAIL